MRTLNDLYGTRSNYLEDVSKSDVSIKCPGCNCGHIQHPDYLDEVAHHPVCRGSGIDPVALKRRFKLGFHAFEMLRLIAAVTTRRTFWIPWEKSELIGDGHSGDRVFVGGGGTVAAIKYLTTHGFVAEVLQRPGGLNEPYARVCTDKGREFLAEIFAAAV